MLSPHRPQLKQEFWFGLIWSAGSLGFAALGVWIFYHEGQVYEQLQREGVVEEARVVSRRISTDDGDESYYVSYSFQVVNRPETFTGEAGVTYDEYERWTEGRSVVILYARSDPSVSRLRDHLAPPSLIGPAVFAGLGLIFCAIGVGLMAANWRG